MTTIDRDKGKQPTPVVNAAGLSRESASSRRRNNVIYVVCKYAGDRAEQCAVPVRTCSYGLRRGRRKTARTGRRGRTEGEGGGLTRESRTYAWALSSRSHPPARESREGGHRGEEKKKNARFPGSADSLPPPLPRVAPGAAADTLARTSVMRKRFRAG